MIQINIKQAQADLPRYVEQAVRGEVVLVRDENEPSGVVLLPATEYERFKRAEKREDWREALNRAVKTGSRIAARRKGLPLDPPENLIAKIREERNAQDMGVC